MWLLFYASRQNNNTCKGNVGRTGLAGKKYVTDRRQKVVVQKAGKHEFAKEYISISKIGSCLE
jgi:hypothetical protein